MLDRESDFKNKLVPLLDYLKTCSIVNCDSSQFTKHFDFKYDITFTSACIARACDINCDSSSVTLVNYIQPAKSRCDILLGSFDLNDVVYLSVWLIELTKESYETVLHLICYVAVLFLHHPS